MKDQALPTFAKKIVEKSRIKALEAAGKRPRSDAERRALLGRIPGTYNVMGFIKETRTNSIRLNQEG